MDKYDLEYKVGIRVLGWGICLCKYQIGYISTTITVVVVVVVVVSIIAQAKVVPIILSYHISSYEVEVSSSNQSKTIRSTFHFQRAMG